MESSQTMECNNNCSKIQNVDQNMTPQHSKANKRLKREVREKYLNGKGKYSTFKHGEGRVAGRKGGGR